VPWPASAAEARSVAWPVCAPLRVPEPDPPAEAPREPWPVSTIEPWPDNAALAVRLPEPCAEEVEEPEPEEPAEPSRAALPWRTREPGPATGADAPKVPWPARTTFPVPVSPAAPRSVPEPVRVVPPPVEVPGSAVGRLRGSAISAQRSRGRGVPGEEEMGRDRLHGRAESIDHACEGSDVLGGERRADGGRGKHGSVRCDLRRERALRREQRVDAGLSSREIGRSLLRLIPWRPRKPLDALRGPYGGVVPCRLAGLRDDPVRQRDRVRRAHISTAHGVPW